MRNQVAINKTRLAVAVPVETYQRLSEHCGTKPGSLWQFVTRAIDAELERVKEDTATQA